MKKLLCPFLVLAIALFAVNCNGKTANTASDIEKSIYTEMQKGNFDKAADLLVSNLDGLGDATAEDKAETIKLFSEKAKQSTEAQGGIKSFEVSEKLSEDGLSAVVSTKVVYNNGTETTESTDYVKKDDSWKIAFGN